MALLASRPHWAITIGVLVAAGALVGACSTTIPGTGTAEPTAHAPSTAAPTPPPQVAPPTTPEVSAPTSSPSTAATIEVDIKVRGDVSILGKGWTFSSRRQRATCEGGGDYSDIGHESAVIVSDGRGRPLGTGYLGQGRAHFGRHGRCIFGFVLSVPVRKSYRISLGGRTPKAFSLADVQHGHVHLEVGSPARRPLHPPPPKVTLRVLGNGSRALVTYAVDTDIRQDTDAALPWSTQMDPFGSFYQVSAQDDDGTSITCEIIGPSGAVLDRNTSAGAYAIASCSYSY